MKLSDAIEKQYRGNLMFHNTRPDILRSPVGRYTSAQVERSFDATFAQPNTCDCRLVLRRSLWCEDCLNAARSR